ncbi:histone-arginine methyltransferase CARMER isoform X1 [Diorhabda carinulata]|uniref:histone-arginine methyltransferase CARMER isoform X1 n=1 Tax=Diorhabda sublineata TaxID=1163346 RepID=UPI0024E069BD|nr:histone-arginine methyltransferase CARMER isoform X1 [Diorhabda sublineata]XP_057658159.1 histone-arginine methyltransferase CARMER isoform X1 [Diorhabda carinulata]
MALKVWIVEVFSINDSNQTIPKYNRKVKLRAEYDPQGISIKFYELDESSQLLEFPVDSETDCCKLGTTSYLFSIDNESILIKFINREEARYFTIAIKKVKSGKDASIFSVRTEDSSAAQYFQFYGYLSQQQNMLQDFVRTYTYQRAILCNLDDFKDKVVLDVGAGSGILSFFAAQAGAKRVYAVEASTMAHYAQKLVEANNLTGCIKVIPGKIEEIELNEKVDVIISEPMGYMLYNERMLESYLNAKKWLVPGGKMYPFRGDLHIVPFTDDALYMEQYSKANFWFQTCFHGVNLSALQNCAVKEYFRQPIVDTFDIRICMSKSIRHVVDFLETDETDLHTIDIPLEFHILESGTCHGLAFWFDVAFGGTQQTIWLSTAPTEPLTHWYQVRCLLEQPLLLKQGQVLTGRVVLVANKRQSYDVTIELTVEGTMQTSQNTLDLKNPYFRYTGAPVQPPPGVSNVSPSESYWSQLDAQGVRNAVNMVNGMSVNGLGEVSMDTTQTLLNNNLMAANNLIALVDSQHMGADGTQPNIHPGSIPSTGRGRVAASPTSTHTAQLIGGAISPSLFTSPTHQQQPLVMANYPISANLMIGDYVKPSVGVAMPAVYRQ